MSTRKQPHCGCSGFREINGVVSALDSGLHRNDGVILMLATSHFKLRQQHRGACGFAGFQFAVGLSGFFQRVSLVDIDFNNTITDSID